jgi:CubicO group peptidase (beta-lactamase class C family)
MERVSGERFDRLTLRLVLAPLRLEACFNWSGCAASRAGHAVVLYRANGAVAKDDLGGRAPACLVTLEPGTACDLATYVPGDNGALFSPQGGLRISMRSLARLGQRLARGGEGFLSPRAFAELTAVAWRFDGGDGVGENGAADGFFCAYGLAVQRIGTDGAPCHDDLFGDRVPRLGHAGDAYGLKAGLWWDPASGRGLAFFTTGVAEDAPKGASAFTSVEEGIVARAVRAASWR